MNDKTVSMRFENKVTGEKKLEKYAETLQKIQAFSKGIDTGAVNQLKSGASSTKSITDDTKTLSKYASAAFNAGGIIVFTKALKTLASETGKYIQKSAEYTENLNLYQVAFNGAYQEADKFVNKLTEMYGLDESWLVRTTGIFKQLSNAMGLSVEQGTKFSTLLTQMSVDISSLYNIDIDKASSVLQSAIAGQTKPIRGATGADITQATLQSTLSNLNIDAYVSNLSYAEKRLLIIISLTQQLQQATNDFGKTIESPANQTRILSEQWQRLSRALGNVFLPIVAKILPYLNAILMVLTEIINMIAGLFGFNIEDFDYGVATISDSFDDLEESVGGAASGVSDLKKQMTGLRGFDKLNNITTPKASSGGGGAAGGAGGGINPKLMEAFNKAFDDYNQKLKNVKMRATEIRDRIMEWLGFTKEIDKETGKVSFKFERITGGTILGALGVGGFIYTGIRKILGFMNKIGLIEFNLPSLAKLTGISGLFKAIGEGIAVVAGGAGTIGEAFTVYVLPALKVVGTRLGGIGLIVTGLLGLIKNIVDIVKNGFNFDNVIQSLQSIALIVSGILLFINPIAAAIALAVAGVLKLVQIIVDNWETIKSTVIDPIVNFFTTIASFIYNNAIKPIIDFFAPIISAIEEVKQYIFDKVIEIVVGIGKAVWSVISKIGEILAKIIEIFVAIAWAFKEYVIKPVWDNFLKPLFSWIYEHTLKPVIDILIKAGVWIYDHVIKPVWDKIIWVRDKIVGLFKTIGIAIADFISGAVKGVINAVLSRVESSINGFIKLLNAAIKIINKIPGVNITKVSLLSIPRLEKGLDFVPKDYYGPVYLDYGERVLTKEENAQYNASTPSFGGSKSSNTAPINPTFIIQIGSKEVAREVLTNLQDMAKSGGKPIKIGG